jgi:hypothetical protein
VKAKKNSTREMEKEVSEVVGVEGLEVGKEAG